MIVCKVDHIRTELGKPRLFPLRFERNFSSYLHNICAPKQKTV